MSPEMATFLSKLGDAATVGSFLAHELKTACDAGHIQFKHTEAKRVLTRALEVIEASKVASRAFERLSPEEQAAYHRED